MQKSHITRHCKFTALLTFDSAQERETVRKTADGIVTQKYWRITDSYGYAYSTKLEIAPDMVYGTMYAVKGIVSQVRGGTYLNIEEIIPFAELSGKLKNIETYASDKEGERENE